MKSDLEKIMRDAIKVKFTQNAHLKQLLLSTKNHSLVQLKPNDNLWGTGPAGKGSNLLGVALQDLRIELSSVQ